MSDDLGTVGPKKDRARELVRLREHYRLHRETLSGLVGDAPSDHLATEYERLIHEIDMAVRKLDELEGKPSAAAAAPAIADTQPAFRPKTQPGHTAPGNRPLVRPEEPAMSTASHSRVATIIIGGIVVLAVIAGLIWYASQKKDATPKIVEQPVTSTTTATAPPTITPETATIAPAGAIKITPALADYGTIRKGTRAVRQFEVVNSSGAPVEIQVARSTCRCLYYDYKAKLPAGGRETITVTIDGGRAKAGDLSVQVQVTAKGDPGISASFTVQAVVQ
jgi:hypothetical protein